MLVGYSDEIPSYRVWDPVKGKVLNVGGADFDEVAPYTLLLLEGHKGRRW